MADFRHELNLVGQRMEEALPKLQSWLDHAILAGIDEIRVVHGKGHGVLREMVRKELKSHPNVATMTDDHADRGGAGITVVQLK